MQATTRYLIPAVGTTTHQRGWKLRRRRVCHPRCPCSGKGPALQPVSCAYPGFFVAKKPLVPPLCLTSASPRSRSYPVQTLPCIMHLLRSAHLRRRSCIELVCRPSSVLLRTVMSLRFGSCPSTMLLRHSVVLHQFGRFLSCVLLCGRSSLVDSTAVPHSCFSAESFSSIRPAIQYSGFPTSFIPPPE